MYSILHIDNNPFFKKLFLKASEKLNIKISFFSVISLKDAHEILNNNKIDLILMGLEFSEKSVENFLVDLNSGPFKSIPVIVLTSTKDNTIKKKLFKLGAIDYITKDMPLNKLISYIENFSIQDSAKKRLEGLKIAILDDSSVELTLYKRIFEFYNIKSVDYYSDPEVLLSVDYEYDIYIIDIVLPKISGEQVISDLRSKYIYSVIIAVSEIDNYRMISNLLSTGVDDYILKPFNTELFMARLKANVRTFILLSELKQKNKTLEEMLTIDGLTQLYNHNYIYSRLETEIKKADRYNHSLSVIMIDIDFFKSVNDNYGHQFGDKVLKSLADTIREEIRSIDIAGRYGGEEFAVILPETNLDGAVSLAERMRISVENMKFEISSVKITASFGVVELKTHTALELIEESDKYLYLAKKNGRNRVEY